MKTVYRMKSLLILLTVPLIALGAGQPPQSAMDPGLIARNASQATAVSPTLIDRVREATKQFKDVNVAIAAGFVQATECVSGPHGAMQFHFVLPTFLTQSIMSDPSVDQPQALIYEPLSNGSLRLVGVDYIVLASAWRSRHPGAIPPALEGQPLSFVDTPSSYRRADYRHSLLAFYELPVMAWEQNQVGSFADWNTALSCTQQPSQS